VSCPVVSRATNASVTRLTILGQRQLPDAIHPNPQMSSLHGGHHLILVFPFTSPQARRRFRASAGTAANYDAIQHLCMSLHVSLCPSSLQPSRSLGFSAIFDCKPF
jgi:hypothetical protein